MHSRTLSPLLNCSILMDYLLISPRFIRFGIVGSIGFLTDAGILSLLVYFFGSDPYLGRGISFPIAVTVTWYLNRNMTFAASPSADKKREWGLYFVVNSMGAGINFIIYSILLYSIQYMYTNPILALAVASIIALFFNYYSSKILVFKQA